MERVLVIGSPGSGKSTLARELAGRTGLPLLQLDQLYWQPGWVEPAKDVWARKVAALIAAPRWIMEGNYGGTLPLRLTRADTVIQLDLPPWLCVARVVRRMVANWRRVRPDMPEGCPERFSWEFLVYTARFRHQGRRRTEAKMQDFTGTFIRLRSRREVDAFLTAL